MKKIINFFLAFILILPLFTVNIAKAETFAVTGDFATAPADNAYQANYILTTTEKSVYYFTLSAEKYKDYVGRKVTFELDGTKESYTVVSSKLAEDGTPSTTTEATNTSESTNNAQLPPTGTGIELILAGAIVGGYLRRKFMFAK